MTHEHRDALLRLAQRLEEGDYEVMGRTAIDDAALLRRLAADPQADPVAHVLFRHDDDGLEPVMFYGPGTAPDPASIKERFTLREVWLSPPPQRQPRNSG